MTHEEVLKSCTVEGQVVKLPDVQLDRKVYLEVKKSLELIGGKWKSGKVKGFVFEEDPTELLAEIASGTKRNIKKEFQFFATPDDLADYVLDQVALNDWDDVLEPSAGQGALVKAIARVNPNIIVDCYELMPVNRKFLEKIPTANLVGDDFLNNDHTKKYDVIIANPPFQKNQDIDHILEMFERLKPGGILFSIASTHWIYTKNRKKEEEFYEWINEVGGYEELDAGLFKESGTNIATALVIIDKP